MDSGVTAWSTPAATEAEAAALPAWPVVLQALRAARGIAREGWGARLGYSVKSVQRWERGESVPNAAAEAALLTLLREEGLLRRHTAGPLRGCTLTEASLRLLLAEARSGHNPPDQPPALRLVATPGVGLPRSSLPAALTSFLGREQELADLAQLLATHRLVTLTGAGGTGKTRLALQVAAAQGVAFPDGVFFVDLAPLQDPTLVPAAIAQVLGLREVEDVPLVDTLVAYLRPRRLLLLIDNFEQVVAAAGVVSSLLTAAAGLQVLVTSRAVLHTAGEQEYPLAPLPLPDLTAGTPSDALERNPAVALFVARAGAVRPDFVLDDRNAAAVAAICARLEGLPLAIELAAARIKLLSPQQLLARLDHRLQLLTGGACGLPARQQTLRAAIQWSYDLLSEAEQRLFYRLAVFAGGCSLSMAEAVAGNQDGTPAAPIAALDVFDGLTALVDKSLLRVQGGPDGEPRFSILATVHEYAQEQLEASGEVPALREEMAQAMVAFAEAESPHLTGSQRQAALARIDAEGDNVRVALAWAIAAGEAELGLRLAGALGYWFRYRAVREGIDWVERLLALPAAADAPRARGWALCTAGICAYCLGEYDAAAARFREALQLLDPNENRRQIVGATRDLAMAASMSGNWELGQQSAREAVAMARELGESWLLAFALHPLVMVTPADAASVSPFLEEAVRHARSAGEPWLLLNTLPLLERRYLRLGDVDAADAIARETEAICRASGLPTDLPLNGAVISLLRLQRGDVRGATANMRTGLLFSRDAGLPAGISINLLCAAAIALAAGRQRDAVHLHSAAVAIAEGHASAERQIAWGGREFAALPQDALSEEQYAAAWAEGRVLGVDAAVALAVALGPDG